MPESLRERLEKAKKDFEELLEFVVNMDPAEAVLGIDPLVESVAVAGQRIREEYSKKVALNFKERLDVRARRAFATEPLMSGDKKTFLTCTEKFQSLSLKEWNSIAPRKLRILKVMAEMATDPTLYLMVVSDISVDLKKMFGTTFTDLSIQSQLDEMLKEGYINQEWLPNPGNFTGTRYWFIHDQEFAAYLRSLVLIP